MEVPQNGWIRCTHSSCAINQRGFFEDDLVTLVQISLKNDTAYYNVTVGCGVTKPAEDQEAFWTAMDHCSENLAREIVDKAFLDY